MEITWNLLLHFDPYIWKEKKGTSGSMVVQHVNHTGPESWENLFLFLSEH